MNRFALTLILAGCAPIAAFCPLLLGAASVQAAPSAAETMASLQRQLAAQKAINAQLQARLGELEQRLAASRRDQNAPRFGLNVDAPPPPVEPEAPTTAIEEALVSKGLVLLPTGTFRLTPSIAWAHNGGGYEHYDSFMYALKLEAGLPWGMAASVQVPYIQRDYPAGRNEGLGDLSVSLGQRLTRETQTLPSTVLRLSYQHDNGEDAFAVVPVGDGLRVATANLSAVKRMEPLVLYGNLSYTHAWSRTLTDRTTLGDRVARIDPADIYGAGLGVSLAATPGVSLNLGLSLDFFGSDMIAPVDGESSKSGFSTVGYIDLGADILLNKHLSLSLAASAGITDDANDFILSLALPYRF